jgi:hypothetical protein
MHKQLWGYKVEEKLHMGVRKQKKKRLNTTDLEDTTTNVISSHCSFHNLLVDLDALDALDLSRRSCNTRKSSLFVRCSWV